MDWYQNAVFYQVYLRAFHDSDGDGNGDFAGLRKKIDYLKWLGVNTLWLMPFYPSPLNDDGYDIASFFGIHEDFGLLEDFRMTVKELKRNGIRVITDLVVNHTSDQHPWFREARRSKDSPMRNYYVWSDSAKEYSDARIIFIDTEESNWSYDEGSQEFYWHRFYSSQPDLNYDNPAVQQAMIDVMRFWLDQGLDGFRVDAVPYLFEREGTNCENLPETHNFLKRMRAYVDAHYPGTLLLAEANQWPRDVIHYFGDQGTGPEFHMCFHFPVMPRLYMAVARGDRQDIVNILNDTPDIPAGAQWATFLRNHDELTLEMVTDEDRDFMWEHYAEERRYRINLGIRRRLAPLMQNDPRRIQMMYSMLFSLPGTPVLYYGDEIGMGDNVTLPDRNGVRTPMQWSDEINGGFSATRIEDLYAPPISDPEYGYRTVNVENQRAEPDSLLNTIRHMIHTYKALPVLAGGELEFCEHVPQHVLAFWRHHKAYNRVTSLFAVHNLTDAATDVELPAGAYRDVLAGDREAHIQGTIKLEPYAYYWLMKHD